MTATAVDPSGSAQTPAVLPPIDEDGRYGGEVAFPTAGAWTVRFSVVTPTATLETTRQVAPTTTTTAATTKSTTDSEEPSGEFDPDDGDGSPLSAAIGIVILLVIVTVAIVGFARSAKRFLP